MSAVGQRHDTEKHGRAASADATGLAALTRLRRRPDVVVIAVLYAVALALPMSLPPGIQAIGVVGGATLALQAVGLILVYQTNRIINFAQIQVGLTAATVFVAWAQLRPMLRWVDHACHCVGRPAGAAIAFNYAIGLVLSLALAVGLSLLLHVIALRFANAPRLTLTIATIFMTELLAGISPVIVTLLQSSDQKKLTSDGVRPPGPPFHLNFRIPPARFDAVDLLTVLTLVVAVAGLALYFRRSLIGVAIRAAADNPNRVETLGVSVGKVTGRVWLFAGLLSWAAAVLTGMRVGTLGTVGGQASLNVSLVVRVLAVAVIAGMSRLWVAGVAAAVLGVLQMAVLRAFGTTFGLDAALVLIIGAVLLTQRSRLSRAEIEQASGWRADRQIRPVPRELRPVASVRKWYRIGAGALALFLLGYPWLMSPSQTDAAVVYMVYAMVGLSLLVLTGWAGQISLGQFALAAAGAYVVGVTHLPFPVELVGGGVVAAVLAVLVGLPALRLRGLHVALMSMAFALSVSSVLVNRRYLGKHLASFVHRPSLVGMSFEDERVFYYFSITVLGLVVAAVAGMRRSRTGRALIASRDNEQAAQTFGINLTRARLEAFAAAGFIAGLGGALYAYSQHGVSETGFSPELSVTIFLLAVVGGFGSIAGPILGAVYFPLVKAFSFIPFAVALGTGGVGLVLLMAAPGGLSSIAFQIRDNVLRRVAARYGIVVPSLLADVAEGQAKPRAKIEPNVRPSGAAVFVPARYRLRDQWGLRLSDDVVLPAHLQAARPAGGRG